MLDIEPIKTRLAATTAGEWKWSKTLIAEIERLRSLLAVA
jgi:hypothetical protein